MKQKLTILFLAVATSLIGQGGFNFSIDLESIQIQGLPGLHSYAFAQAGGKWLIIGGRKDGLHARQPFAAFPQNFNNTDLYVIDVQAQQFWSASLNPLPTGIREQLQATNMNFFQDDDTLYIIGGYAFSQSANDHITFPNLTTIQVSSLINAIINNQPALPHFKQITDNVFAVTGGQLGKIGSTFYLIGGHRFDGRYNPMGGTSYTQNYTHQIRKFTIDNSGTQLSYANYSAITDPIHLRRRDYNLLPQIFPNGSFGYTISAGVFQLTADLPFLYPVDITETAHIPITSFNQLLSHYHSARLSVYDSISHEMHSLFFGGMSQFYYLNEQLIEDIQVPFVNTISRLTRFPNGSLHEYKHPEEMPGYIGASAEFITNQALPHFAPEVIHLTKISTDTILVGHIYGGILSPSQNPFSLNQTSTTIANPTIYAVRLIRNSTADMKESVSQNPYEISISPNPMHDELQVTINRHTWSKIDYFLTNTKGQVLYQDVVRQPDNFGGSFIIKPKLVIPPQTIMLTVVVDNRYYFTSKLVKQ